MAPPTAVSPPAPALASVFTVLVLSAFTVTSSRVWPRPVVTLLPLVVSAIVS